MNLLALIVARILERELCDARAGLLRHDFQAFHYARHDFMFQAGIEAFRVLAHDDEVNIGISGRYVRQIANWTKIGVKLESLPECNVDARESATHGGRDRPLQCDVGPLDGLDQILGDIFARFFKGLRTDREGLPFKLDAGSFQNAHGGLSHFGADAVAGNQGYLMSHKMICPREYSVAVLRTEMN